MKESSASSPRLGGVAAVTQPDTSAKLNVEEYTSITPDLKSTGFPKQDGQSLSYWLQQVRCDPLLDHRTSAELLKEADTVVIGSGVGFSYASPIEKLSDTFPAYRHSSRKASS
jgi:hypothetical protein